MKNSLNFVNTCLRVVDTRRFNQVENVLAIWTKRAPNYATNYENILALCSDWNEYDVEKAVVIMLDRCEITPCGVDDRLKMVESILETLKVDPKVKTIFCRQ
jgi:hypothetical protein